MQIAQIIEACEAATKNLLTFPLNPATVSHEMLLADEKVKAVLCDMARTELPRLAKVVQQIAFCADHLHTNDWRSVILEILRGAGIE